VEEEIREKEDGERGRRGVRSGGCKVIKPYCV
jgi:hypothetical protein